jgi:hypothetical protein
VRRLFGSVVAGGLFFATTVAAGEPCTQPGTGWCVARRIAGNATKGELGFRFGEPLDVDGDGNADIAAGARFERRGKFRYGVAGVWSSATGSLIRNWEGQHRNGLFGHWVLPVADLDGDRLADTIIAAPHAIVEGVGRGLLTARSPASGKEIWQQVGGADESFGWDLAPAGDHDGDGHSDLFVGAPDGEVGRVYLLSGKSGKRIRSYAPATAVRTFGWYVARLDDVDGDGFPDLAAGAFLEKDSADVPRGGAYVFSARSGAQLHHWIGPDAWSCLGDVVAAVADVDGDGRGEVAVSLPRTFDQARDRPGDVHIYSAASGSLLRRWSGSQAGELFGRMVVSTADLNGDGVDDIAVSAPWHRRQGRERAGRVELRCGKSGEVLAELYGEVAEAWFGWHIRRAPDPEGRGFPALLISSLRHTVAGKPQVGVMELYVFRRAQEARTPQGTINRGARRSDIR